jgi:integrase/transposase InsO family protein
MKNINNNYSYVFSTKANPSIRLLSTDKVSKGIFKKDLVRQRYNSNELDLVWFIDMSCFGNYWVVLLLDCASRRVIAYKIKQRLFVKKKNSCPFTTADCIATISSATLDNQIPSIIHSDNGGQFVSQQYQDYLTQCNIQRSIVESKYYTFGNQTIERLFRTLKGYMLKQNKQYRQITDSDQFNELFKSVIEIYNNKVHRSLIGLSPNSMQDALVLHQPKPTLKLKQLTKNLSVSSLDVDQIKSIAVQNYATNWLQFFIEWKELIIDELKQEYQKGTELLSNKLDQHKLLLEQLKTNLNEMEQRALKAEAALKAKQDAKLRRQQRQRVPLRDPAGPVELDMAIEYINNQQYDHYTKNRDILCLCLLYFTGLRVSNLLLLQTNHIKNLLQEGQFDIQLIKKKKNIVQTYFIPTNVYSIFEKYKQYFEQILLYKQDNQYIATAQGSDQIMHRVNLNRRLNQALRFVSTQTHKNVKTHSFRISLTTALIQTVGIEAASKAIGHNDIRTTEMYNRRALTPTELANAYKGALTFLEKQKNLKLKKKQRKLKDKTLS